MRLEYVYNFRVYTCIYPGEYTLHGVCGSVATSTGLTGLIALGAKVKVVADKTLVTFT